MSPSPPPDSPSSSPPADDRSADADVDADAEADAVATDAESARTAAVDRESTATRIVIGYRLAGDDGDDADTVPPPWVIEGLDTDHYRQYLRRAHGGPVAVGDTWAETVTKGCAPPGDVVLTIRAVEGGTRLGPDTAIAFDPLGATDDATARD